MRIQLKETDQPLFDSGSDVLKPFAAQILSEIGKELTKMRNHIVVGGHTDSIPYMRAGRSNWDLSAERANSALRTIMAAGVPYSQVKRVTGYADTIPGLDANDNPLNPRNPQNRRLSIVVLSSRYEAFEAAARQTRQAPPQQQQMRR
jgi:chemotaxis protein MotB